MTNQVGPDQRGLDIEVVYAAPGREAVRRVLLPAGATVADALQLAAAHPDFDGLDVCGAVVGIFGKVVPRERALVAGDRIELLRPLAIDPKDARRARVREARRRGPSGQAQ